MGFRMLGTLLLAAVLAGAQDVKITVPHPRVPGQVERMGDHDYGPPRPVELEALGLSPETYQRAHVMTVGRLDVLKQGLYWSLRDGSAAVLVLLGHELTAGDLSPLLGARLEVRGIVRRIRKKEYTRDGTDWDLVEDPSLPVLPAPSYELPPLSITVLGFTEKRTDETAPAGALAAMVRDILEDPAGHANRKVRIVGQFRGSNLFRDLPEGSRRNRGDWVLKDGLTAVWIVGKEARGKGWALDPAYEGDTVRTLAVEGKPEVVNGVVYLRASKVSLTAKPKSWEDDGS